MAVLIGIYTPKGCAVRCDARCYNAAGGLCECICGGMNHGKGRRKAAENTHKHHKEWTQHYVEQHGLTDYTVELDPQVLQLPLL